MKRILVTGGPVHAHLDSVKIVTNKFRGGRMAALAEELDMMGFEVDYLTATHTRPKNLHLDRDVLTHEGFNDYMFQVVQRAHEYDAVVLGAAVANLIPSKPWKGKFPSHDYKPGDRIKIDFEIAPRVIDQVRVRAPKVQVFGFKLLDGVPREELIRAAYDIVLEAGATAVFANDRQNLDMKLAVTKERSVQQLSGNTEVAEFIAARLADEFYRTQLIAQPNPHSRVRYMEQHEPRRTAWLRCQRFAKRYASKFQVKHGSKGLVFGTIAARIEKSPSQVGFDEAFEMPEQSYKRIRRPTGVEMIVPAQLSFVTTVRGKNELEDWTHVTEVDHEERVVKVVVKKATLNAPLLHMLFAENPEVRTIVHFHETGSGLPKLPWAPPGTVQDSMRICNASFEVEHHGVYLLFDENERDPMRLEKLV